MSEPSVRWRGSYWLHLEQAVNDGVYYDCRGQRRCALEGFGLGKLAASKHRAFAMAEHSQPTDRRPTTTIFGSLVRVRL